MAEMNLGFILSTGEKAFRDSEKDGHIEVAERIIKSNAGMAAKYEHSIWRDPVDFLIFDEGALKVGNRYGVLVITYYPKLLSKPVKDAIIEYRALGYKEDRLEPPGVFGVARFHY